MGSREAGFGDECQAKEAIGGDRFGQGEATRGKSQGRKCIRMGSVEEKGRVSRGKTHKLSTGEGLGAMDIHSKEVGGTQTLPWIGQIEGRASSANGFDEGSGDSINACQETRR